MKWVLIFALFAAGAAAAGYFVFIHNMTQEEPVVTESALPGPPKELMNIFSSQGERSLAGRWIRCTQRMATDPDGNREFIYQVTIANFPGPREVNYFRKEVNECPDPSALPADLHGGLPDYSRNTFWLVSKSAKHHVEWYRGLMNERAVPKGLASTLSVVEYQQMSEDNGRKTPVYFYIDDSHLPYKLYTGGAHDAGRMGTAPWINADISGGQY